MRILTQGIFIWPRVHAEDFVFFTAASHAAQPLFLDSTPPLAGVVGDGFHPLKDIAYQWDDETVRATNESAARSRGPAQHRSLQPAPPRSRPTGLASMTRIRRF